MTTTKTKFNQSEAARIVGCARNTIAAHIKSGRLSASKDSANNLVIDRSELLRVYGNEIDFERVGGSAKPKQDEEKTASGKGGHQLHAQLRMTEQLLEAQTEERSRERARMETEIHRLEAMLERSEERQSKITLLLEDRTRGIGAWEKSFQELQRQVAEQEKTLREKTTEAQQQAKRYKQAYQAEKSKTIWQKLFG